MNNRKEVDMKDGWDGISSEGWGLIEGVGLAIEGYGNFLDLNPISI